MKLNNVYQYLAISHEKGADFVATFYLQFSYIRWKLAKC